MFASILSYVDFNDTAHFVTFEVGPEEMAVEALCDAIDFELDLASTKRLTKVA